jgi:hypothetical protein
LPDDVTIKLWGLSMAESTTSPESCLGGESELSRQGIWHDHSSSRKGKYRGARTVEHIRLHVPPLGPFKQLSARSHLEPLEKSLKVVCAGQTMH